MAQMLRKNVEERFTWRTSDLFDNWEVWTAEKEQLIKDAAKIVDFTGQIASSPAKMLEFFLFYNDVSKRFARLSIYSSLNCDEDLGNADNIARDKELEQAYIDYSIQSAFVRTELSKIDKDLIGKYLSEEPRLEQFRVNLERIERQKAHILSDVEEELMAKTNLLGDTPYSTFELFSNAEFPWPEVRLESGESVVVRQAEFSRLRASPNRNDREAVFYAFWRNYKKYEGTMGELMTGKVRQNVFYAKARKYDSALEASLCKNNIPVDVYYSLVANINDYLPVFHRYLSLKKRLLGVDTLKYSDLYAPAVKEVDLKFTYAEAQKLVLEALTVLGEEYKDVVCRAFAERWIDVYPNNGKRSGAYSNGGAYDVHPYILMNFNGSYAHVETLIHELGHTMHSYYSNKNQPYNLSHYATFVAEVASTFNEALLDDMMLRKLENKAEKISLLMSILDGFKGTLFRQTQFAEFELAMHEGIERGEAWTGKILSKLYLKIARKYYGHNSGVCYVDDCVAQEWQFVPHFYMGFYVYQYSTAFVASQALSKMVLDADTGARNKYLHFLTTGCSKDPIDILKDAGVDMTSSQPFQKAIERMNMLMDMIESLIK